MARAVALAGMCLLFAPLWAAAGAGEREPDFRGEPASAEVGRVARWVVGSGDNRGLPFAIVDKRQARLHVFEAQGRLVGSSAALLGLAAGDDSVPGIGERPLAQILPSERTTPAGRFVSEPGRNLDGEHVVWVEYESGFAIHRLRPGPARERRAQRLASPAPQDKRVSLGCVVVPVAFYEGVVARMLGRTRGVVYVLPETRSLQEVFGPGVAETAQDL